VPRLLRDQRERNQPQVALRKHPPGAQIVAAERPAHAGASTPAVPVPPAAMPPARPALVVVVRSAMSHPMHWFSPWLGFKIYR